MVVSMLKNRRAKDPRLTGVTEFFFLPEAANSRSAQSLRTRQEIEDQPLINDRLWIRLSGKAPIEAS
jgi:hypothetical protein